MQRVQVRRFAVPSESIDMNGHVNNKEYLRWMEEIAIAHSSANGWSVERYMALGKTWYVRSHYVEYLRPAHASMPMTVVTWVATMDRCASLRRYAFFETAAGKPLANAETLWIFVDMTTGRPADVPPALREALPVVRDDDPEIAAYGELPALSSRRGQ